MNKKIQYVHILEKTFVVCFTAKETECGDLNITAQSKLLQSLQSQRDLITAEEKLVLYQYFWVEVLNA